MGFISCCGQGRRHSDPAFAPKMQAAEINLGEIFGKESG